MVEARVGAVPLVEPAEEVRALLLRLCCALLERGSAETFGHEASQRRRSLVGVWGGGACFASKPPQVSHAKRMYPTPLTCE